MWQYPIAYAEREQSGQDRAHEHNDQRSGQHLAGILLGIGDGCRHQSKDDQRHQKADKLTKELVECHEDTHKPRGHKKSGKNTHDHRQKHQGNNGKMYFFDRVFDFHTVCRFFNIWPLSSIVPPRAYHPPRAAIDVCRMHAYPGKAQ